MSESTDGLIHSVDWTEEKVNRFWSLLASTPLAGGGFADTMAPVLCEIVEAVRPAPAIVLDFGAGDGALARALLARGYSVAVYDPAAGRTESMQRLGLDDWPGFLGVVDRDSPQCFDVVTCFEVLEHILPEAFDADLDCLARFVASGGVVIGSVPSNEVLEASLCLCPDCGALFHRYQHLRSFDERTLGDTLEKIHAGLSTIVWIDGRYYFVTANSQELYYINQKHLMRIRDAYNEERSNIYYYRDEIQKYAALQNKISGKLFDFLIADSKFSCYSIWVVKLFQKLEILLGYIRMTYRSALSKFANARGDINMAISRFELARKLPFVEISDNRWEKSATAMGGLFQVRKDKTTNAMHFYLLGNEVYEQRSPVQYASRYEELYSQRFENNSLSYLEDIVKEQFRHYMGTELNLDNPQTFSEKLNWMKIYYHDPLMTICADKVRSKEYVTQKMPDIDGHFIENYGVFKNASDVDFAKLPNSFVLKSNWGSGAQILVPDKSRVDVEHCRGAMRDWLHPHSNHYYVAFEYGYKNIPPRIVCEKLIEYDYKIEFFCFNGKPVYYWIIYNDKTSDVHANFYTLDGEKLPLVHKYPNFTEDIKQPGCFGEVLYAAKVLCADFPFVRVDFYKTPATWYFCELTFVHWAGLMPFTPSSFDAEFGKHLTLPKVMIDTASYKQ